MSIASTATMAPPAALRVETEESRLVAASVGGDPDAFAELVRRHQQRVFRLAGRFFRRREDVEEAAQETFVTVWEKLGSYRGEAPLEHWITRVCLNCCYARLRKERPAAELEETSVEAPRRDPDARLEVERLMAVLPARDRFVLLLLHGEGWSVSEIAERLGWSRANVKVRAHRARKKLRQALEAGL